MSAVDWVILGLGVAVAALGLYTHQLNRRAERDRSDLRHITGPRRWWGQR